MKDFSDLGRVVTGPELKFKEIAGKPGEGGGKRSGPGSNRGPSLIVTLTLRLPNFAIILEKVFKNHKRRIKIFK